MKKQNIAVIGHPIGHTMSPFIHKRLFALSQIPFEYSVLDVENLDEDMGEFGRLREFDCFNVTIPYKEEIIPYLDVMDERGRFFGSVNTVYKRNGKLNGTTTDGIGCLKALESHGIKACEKTLILGNGGAARAIAFEIAYSQDCFDITFAHNEKSSRKLEKIIDEMKPLYDKNRGIINSRTYPELESGSDRYNLIINTTSVGMYPKMNACVISEDVIKRSKNVFDAVYNPDETELIKRAKKLEIKTVGGIEMLVNQAAAAHEIWFGVKYKDSDIEEICKSSLVEMERIFK